MTPREFLRLLWGQKLQALYMLIWTRQGKESKWFQDIDGAASFVEKVHGADVYVGVGLSRSDNGEHRRCASDEIAGIAGLWADFDLRSAAHSNKALPGSIEEALTIIRPDLPPTITVATGNGVHGWWLFDKPWIFCSAEERRDASILSTRFQTLLQYNASQKGWAFERLADLARVLRIPGTVNAKDPENPKNVEIYSVQGRRYKPAEIRDYLDALAIPDANAQERAREELEQRFADSSLIVNLTAAVPEELLAQWLSRDLRFRRTWNRERDDMADQSGSGYDLALACFGVNAGLTDQQIVDLIVHHRRMHGDAQRKRVEYFQRTISKARKTEVGPGPAGVSAEDKRAPGADDSPDQVSRPCEITKKARLCDQLSSLLGVRILRLVKIPGKHPVYLMELEEGRIAFDISKLTSHKAVSLALADKAGKIIPTIRGQRWRELLQTMLDACTVVDATDDLHLEGWARIQLEHYLSDTPFISSLAGVSRQDLRKPLIWNREITVSSTDLQGHLNRTTMQNHSVPDIAAMLTVLGGRAVRVRGGTFKEQSRWAMPMDEFPPTDYGARYQEDDSDAE